MQINEDTVVVFENQIGKLTFAYDSPLWITDIKGISRPRVDISASQGSGQIGSSKTNATILPREPTIDGCIRDEIGYYREHLINVMAPDVATTMTLIEGNESWCLDVELVDLEIAPGSGEQPFQMKVYAAYPNWRTTKQFVTMVAGLVPLFHFPFYSGGQWKVSKFS